MSYLCIYWFYLCKPSQSATTEKYNSNVHQNHTFVHCPVHTRTPLTSSPPVTLAASRSAVLICNPWSSQPWVPFLYSVFCSSRLGIGPVLPRRFRESIVSSSEALSPSSAYPSKSSVWISSLKVKVRYSVLDQPVPARMKNGVSGMIPYNHSIVLHTLVLAAVFPVFSEIVQEPAVRDHDNFLLWAGFQPATGCTSAFLEGFVGWGVTTGYLFEG